MILLTDGVLGCKAPCEHFLDYLDAVLDRRKNMQHLLKIRWKVLYSIKVKVKDEKGL